MNELRGIALDDADRRIVVATQAGLPLVPEPYHAVGQAVGLAPEEVMHRFRRLLDLGVIRRIGAVPNHYALGVRANGMSVWDVDDARVNELGARVGALRFVSHCYRRPRVPPHWRYNLFAMVHGRERGEVEIKVAEIAELLGAASRAHEVLYSIRILKKSGMRIREAQTNSKFVTPVETGVQSNQRSPGSRPSIGVRGRPPVREDVLQRFLRGNDACGMMKFE